MKLACCKTLFPKILQALSQSFYTRGAPQVASLWLLITRFLPIESPMFGPRRGQGYPEKRDHAKHAEQTREVAREMQQEKPSSPGLNKMAVDMAVGS